MIKKVTLSTEEPDVHISKFDELHYPNTLGRKIVKLKNPEVVRKCKIDKFYKFLSCIKDYTTIELFTHLITTPITSEQLDIILYGIAKNSYYRIYINREDSKQALLDQILNWYNMCKYKLFTNEISVIDAIVEDYEIQELDKEDCNETCEGSCGYCSDDSGYCSEDSGECGGNSGGSSNSD